MVFFKLRQMWIIMPFRYKELLQANSTSPGDIRFKDFKTMMVLITDADRALYWKSKILIFFSFFKTIRFTYRKFSA
jgi:hypothetical protein